MKTLPWVGPGTVFAMPDGELGPVPSLPVSPVRLEVFTDEKTCQRQMPPTTPSPCRLAKIKINISFQTTSYALALGNINFSNPTFKIIAPVDMSTIF